MKKRVCNWIRPQVQLCLALATIILPALSCSPVEGDAGRCKKLTDPKYVASISDSDGKPWKIELIPEAADLTCDYSPSPTEPTKTRPSGEIVFSARILDSQGQTKPGLRVSGDFSGASTSDIDTQAGFYPNPNKIKDGDTDDLKTDKERRKDRVDDVATDGCGVAVFYVKWVCPDPKKSIGGSFYVKSGPLFSKPVKVTLENSVQPDVVAATPAAGAGGAGGAGGP